ncbi:MAG: DUF4382 domain-containing protein [Pseudanabaenales cyanobacterium]|nr:DUF4382 domain-containing protein [Pseudanabaenales cyanobacterium]
MKQHSVLLSTLMFFLGSLALLGCSQGRQTIVTAGKSETASDLAPTEAKLNQLGTLEIRANGEDFVRRGFVSKDGWRISFDHVYVNLVDITAYQTHPPFDPEAGGDIKAIAEVSLPKTLTVDLAAGDENAAPILIGQAVAPPGRYNALSWKMLPADEGPAAGYVLTMMGAAEKAGQVIDFTINVDQPYTYTCGDFVGDQRKGILEAGGEADLEITFHFDHIFGDGDASAEDAINTGALGFEPLTALADRGRLQVDLGMLKESLSVVHYINLEAALMGLAHVGEGHCEESEVSP